MISGVIPRPIALVSSISEKGVYNLAPFRRISVFFLPDLIPYTKIHTVGLIQYVQN